MRRLNCKFYIFLTCICDGDDILRLNMKFLTKQKWLWNVISYWIKIPLIRNNYTRTCLRWVVCEWARKILEIINWFDFWKNIVYMIIYNLKFRFIRHSNIALLLFDIIYMIIILMINHPGIWWVVSLLSFFFTDNQLEEKKKNKLERIY